MNHEHIFKPTNSQQNQQYEYLGSDGLPISQSHMLYLMKCNEFKTKAKKYAQENIYLKNSHLLHNKIGYESSEKCEEEILLERKDHKANYMKGYDVSLFDEDPNAMYESFVGQSKRIRLIREITSDGPEEFSEDFERKRSCWFTRYCILSRFIQAARSIIILNRLMRNLAILKTLTPAKIRKLENAKGEEEKLVETLFEQSEEKTETNSQFSGYPCGCVSRRTKTENLH